MRKSSVKSVLLSALVDEFSDDDAASSPFRDVNLFVAAVMIASAFVGASVVLALGLEVVVNWVADLPLEI